LDFAAFLRAINEPEPSPQIFNDQARKLLIQAIVKHWIREKVKPCRSDFEGISTEIELRYPTEDKVN
jgi:hypothetical protein